MPRATQKRQKTRFPGVYYVELKDTKSFYIRYRRDGKLIEEKAGTSATGMTAAKANLLRAERLAKKSAPNTERRAAEREHKERTKWTLHALWLEYAATRRSDPSKPFKSFERDEDRFLKHFPSIWHLQPEQLDHLAFERWKRSIAKGRAPATANHCLELLRRVANFGIERKLCAGLPFKLVIKTPDNRTTEYLTPEELQGLLRVLETEEPITANMFRLALYAWLRRGELLKLTWSDVDFEKRELRLKDTKAGRDQTLPLSEQALTILENQPRHPSGSELVFPSPRGCAWSRSTLDRVFKRVLAKADLPPGSACCMVSATFLEVYLWRAAPIWPSCAICSGTQTPKFPSGICTRRTSACEAQATVLDLLWKKLPRGAQHDPSTFPGRRRPPLELATRDAAGSRRSGKN